jgi:hypothetical protein
LIAVSPVALGLLIFAYRAVPAAEATIVERAEQVKSGGRQQSARRPQ